MAMTQAAQKQQAEKSLGKHVSISATATGGVARGSLRGARTGRSRSSSSSSSSFSERVNTLLSHQSLAQGSNSGVGNLVDGQAVSMMPNSLALAGLAPPPAASSSVASPSIRAALSAMIRPSAAAAAADVAGAFDNVAGPSLSTSFGTPAAPQGPSPKPNAADSADSSPTDESAFMQAINEVLD
mmetsp:Transcript_4905/g.13731  ORF Transcript_4905/g.13731 Transcript_4905/m.13731 type:complete len:184 (+) Transcript_4905:310-861(+)